MPGKKPHTSPSQIATFEKCPEAWRRRYILGEKIPPGVKALIGSGVHGAARENFKQKIETHHDLLPSVMADMAVAALDQRMDEEGGVWLHEEEQGQNEQIVMGAARDTTAKLARFHSLIVAPNYQPILTEHEFRIELPKLSHDLVGVLDLLDDQTRVVDFKTTGRKKSQQEADRSLQLTSYAVGVYRMTGQFPTSLVLDVTMRKENPEHKPIVTQRDSSDVQILANHINAFTQSVNAGIFHPAPEGAWWCSKKFCGYAATCPYYSQRTPDK